MIYSIPLKNLEKIANPFEQISVRGLDSPITIYEINELLEKGKLSNYDSKVRVKLLEDTVKAIVNFNIDIPLHINLDTPINIETGWVVENVPQLAAFLYFQNDLKIENIKANIVGKNEIIDTIFKPISIVNLDQSISPILISNKKYKNSDFNWKIETLKIGETIEEKQDRILLEDDISTIVKLSTPAMWNNNNFVKAVFVKIKEFDNYQYVLDEIPNEYWYNPVALEIAKEDAVVFKYIWQQIEKENEPTNNNLKKKNNVTSLDKKRNQALEKLQLYLENENLFEQLMDIVPIEKLKNYTPFVSDKLLMKTNIIEKSYSLKDKNDGIFNYYGHKESFLSLFPKRYFQKPVNVFTFVDNLGSRVEGLASSKSYTYMFKHIVKDKESILNTLGLQELKNHNSIRNIIKCIIGAMDHDLKKDIDIIKKLIDLEYVEVLDSVLVNIENLDLLTIEKSIMNGYVGKKIPRATIFKMTNPYAITRYLRSHPEAINDNKFPIIWLENVNNLQALAKNLVLKNLPEKIQYIILNDKELLKEIVYENKQIYIDLPIQLKILPLIFNSYVKNLTQNDKDDKYWKALPRSVWLNDNFTINAIIQDFANIKNLPKEKFNDKQFIIELFSKVKEHKINELLLKLPKEITQFFVEHNIKEKHSQFLEKVFFKDDLESIIPDKEIIIKKKKI